MCRTWLLLAGLLIFSASAAEPETPARPLRVLLLFASDLLMPDAITEGEITESAIRAAVPAEIEFFPEALDALRLPGAEHEREFVALLRQRYASTPPDLIVGIGPMDGFIGRRRSELWPGTPVMLAGISPRQLASPTFPMEIPTTTVPYDVAGTVNLALTLQPDAKRLVVVAGSDQYDRNLLEFFRPTLERYRDRLSLESMPEGSVAKMSEYLAGLPRDSIVLHLPVLRDGAGRVHVPIEIGRRLVAAANAPSYSFYDRTIGSGAVGGSLLNWAGQRETIGAIARELLLGGVEKSSLSVHPPVAPRCAVDWRQLQRWKIPEARVPKGCTVLFRPPGFWQQYRRQAIIAILVVAAQSVLIAALLIQRHRRRQAELQAQQRREELAHAGRLATVGELSAAIAHEINQPLAAILSNAEAGETLLEAGRLSTPELREIFAAIRKDDERASEIIQQLRRLLHKEPTQLQPVDLNVVIAGTLQLVAGALRHNAVSLRTDLVSDLPLVNGDIVQLQQVLMNLLMNAMDAMRMLPKEERWVTVASARCADQKVEMAVSDRGTGIPPERLGRVFEPFFSTKANGMGLGLSISHSIVSAHGGEIWADSGRNGTTLHVRLPARWGGPSTNNGMSR